VNLSGSTGTNSWDATLASKLNYTGGTGADRTIGTAGADTISTGAGNDIVYGDGRTETVTISGNVILNDTIAVTVNGSTVTQTATGTDESAEATALAALITADYANNGGATAAAVGKVITITYNTYFGTAASSTATQVGSGSSVASADAVTSLGANAGDDTINGGTGDDVLFGGAGEDSITTGTGDDDIVWLPGLTNTGLSTAPSGTTVAGATIANGDKITFANGVDVINDFTSGTDDLVVSQATATFEGVVPTTLIGEDPADFTDTKLLGARGDFVSSTGVFTFSATGADFLLTANDGTAADDVASTNTNFVVLVGVTALVAGDLI
jgi:Ca2+-binding RTX toxin-like protein